MAQTTTAQRPQVLGLNLSPVVLVLSPNDGLGTVAARFLGKRGCSATSVATMAQALDEIQRRHIDALLADIPEEKDAWPWEPLALEIPMVVLAPARADLSGMATPGGPRPHVLRKPVAWDSVARRIAAALTEGPTGLLTSKGDMGPLVPAGAATGMRPLSPREREVLGLLVDGRSNKAIAQAMRLSEPTVKKHVQQVIGKLGAGDRTHAAVIALRAGLVS